jgi:hypothetical protein
MDAPALSSERIATRLNLIPSSRRYPFAKFPRVKYPSPGPCRRAEYNKIGERLIFLVHRGSTVGALDPGAPARQPT